MSGQGFRLIGVSGYAAGGQERYAAIWEQLDGPAWEARYGLTEFRYQESFNVLIGLGYWLMKVNGFCP
jgi:hypothetical protein